MTAGKYADDQGLWLVKRSKQAGKWILRFSVFGKRREMGFGPWPEVSIAEARTKAAEARAVLRNGTDPVAARQKEQLSVRKLALTEAIDSCFKLFPVSANGQIGLVPIYPKRLYVRQVKEKGALGNPNAPLFHIKIAAD